MCLVIDVGATSFASGYLDRAIKCTSQMIQRKVYSESEDKYAMVLVGCRRSRNDLDYPNIMVVDNSNGKLAQANFGHLKFVEKELKNAAGPEVLHGDWMDAVIVAMDLIHNATEGSKVRSKRIIVLTDMGCEASDDKLEMVMDAIKRDQIEFTFLLPEWDDVAGYNISNDEIEHDAAGDNEQSTGEPEKNKRGIPGTSSETKPRTAIQNAGINLMESIFSVSPEAEKCGIEVAQELLFTKERKKKKSMAWKVDLEIGPDIRIPTAGYVSIRRENPKSWKRCLAKESNLSDTQGFDELKPETTFVRNNEDQEVVEPENLIDAFKYGSKVCPMSEVEKSAGKYDGGPKSLLLIGFVKRAEVPVSLLLGEGCMMFKPVDSNYSKLALSSLVEAMVREEMVAIVRRVYQKNSGPKLAALIPEDSINAEQEEIRSLVYIELPYSEDLRNYQFPPLWNSVNNVQTQSIKNEPTQDQLTAVDSLIDNMMLESEGHEEDEEEEGCLKTETLLNPYYQHLYQCLTSRALNPAKGRSLPKVDQRIKEIMEAPESINAAASKPLAAIAELFKLETVAVKKEKKTGDKMFKNIETKESDQGEENGVAAKRLKLSQDSIDLSLNGSSGNNVTEVGTTTPVQDFEKLLQIGFHINTIAIQMEKVILNFIKASFANQMNDKVIACLQCYRQACIELKSPTVYNKFVRELKEDFLYGQNTKETMWQEIVRNCIGLIDKTDCSLSSVSTEESKAFLKAKEVKTHETSSIVPNDEAEDLLDDL